MPLTLIRLDRPVYDYDTGDDVGTEEVYVVRNGDDTFEFPAAPALAHRALDFLDEANRAGRDTFRCSWTIRLTGHRLPPEVDFPSDLYGPCDLPAAADADGNGFTCLGGHAHRSDLEYFDDDEIAGARAAGRPLPANAARMNGASL